MKWRIILTIVTALVMLAFEQLYANNILGIVGGAATVAQVNADGATYVAARALPGAISKIFYLFSCSFVAIMWGTFAYRKVTSFLRGD